MIQQERNLSYVALTRAKEKLYLVRCKSDEKEKDYTADYEF
jgi:superfamily I DNA/RNA helicase